MILLNDDFAETVVDLRLFFSYILVIIVLKTKIFN